MARKFLYFFAFLVILVIAVLIVMRVWSKELTRFAFMPGGAFEQQVPLAAGAYDNPAMWFSRPGMGANDPAQWLPPGWQQPATPQSRAAVFFIPSSSYFGRKHWNAPLDDSEAGDRTVLFVKAMATPFNRSVALWVPRYRSAAFGALLTSDPKATMALDLAYADVAVAFDHFIASAPQDVPLILAGHGQGAWLLARLLKNRVAGTPLAKRIVAVYAAGWPLSTVHDLPLMGLPACAGPNQPGCVLSWSAYAEPAVTGLAFETYATSTGLDGKQRGGSPILCTNPLTGTSGGSAGTDADLGTLVPATDMIKGEIKPHLVPARCAANGMLLIGPSVDLGNYVLPGNDYHFYDFPLFWANIRQDAARREAAWWQAH